MDPILASCACFHPLDGGTLAPVPMRQLPTGTLTLLFTDIEGSTRLLHTLGERYADALADHRRLFREAVAAHHGVEVDTQGDAFFCVFARASDAIVAAADAQRVFAAHAWPEDLPVRVRMGIHTGEPESTGEGYVGPTLHEGARVMAAGHGGQVLLSEPTALLAGRLAAGLALRDLGAHRLKDLTGPKRLYQLEVEGLPSEFPPLKTLDTSPTNLPVQPTPLVGRAPELAELASLLAQPQLRLLTLTGPGGTGKTRLALQAAADALERYRDGVFSVLLAPVRDSSLLLPTVAQTMGLREAPGLSIEDTLADYLADKQLLLVLDNLEHLLAGVPSLAPLLASAPRLTVLATSRVALHLSGEQRYPVPPLSLPEPAEADDPDTLRRSEAVALFCARAEAAKPGFSLTADNAGAIVSICRRLDGLPLALELAAARTLLLSPGALLARLEQSLGLLTGGARDADERQQTLRATIDWSYTLLEEEEQLLFTRLAVFVGGFTLTGAEAICAPKGELDVLEGVSSLLEKSLLREQLGRADEPRLYMLETIREYAGEKLEERGEGAAVRRRHAEWFLELAERAEPELRGSGQLDWLERLDDEHDNLRAGLGWALDAGETEIALGFGSSLARFWDFRVQLSEGLRWTKAALALEGGAPEKRAKALLGAGCLAGGRGDLAESIRFLERALSQFRVLGDIRAVANALVELAYTRSWHGDLAEARALAGQGLELARAEDDRWRFADALAALAVASPPEQAIPLLEQSEAIFRECGDEMFAVRAQGNSGWLSAQAGDYEGARTKLEKTLVRGRQLGDVIIVGNGLINLGLTELLAGQLEPATAYLRDGLELARGPRLQLQSAEALGGLAGVAASLREVGEAARLKGAAQAIYEKIDAPLTPIDCRIEERLICPVRVAHEQAFEAAYAEGRAMSYDDAVAYGLDEGRSFSTSHKMT
jgi:predicted ATPase/class 3 adenylate cyclase